MRNTLKKLFVFDMLYAFLVAALAVMVPLYLIDIGVDVISIGAILSLLPLMYMFLRIVFASIADQIGTKMVEILESVAMIAAILIYSLSRSAPGFALGSFTEGVRDAGFWATARTDIKHANGKRDFGNALAYFVGIRHLADGFGRISIGILIVYLSFQTSFFLLFVLSLIMFGLLLTINKNPFRKFPGTKIILKKIFHKRSWCFWHNSLGLTTQQVIPNVLLTFILPLYLYSNLQLNYLTTAIVIGLYSLITALANLAVLKLRLSINKLLLLVLFMVPAFLFIPYLGANPLLAIVVLGIGSGCGNILSEYILSDKLKNCKNLSTEIGITFIPLRISEFLFMFLGGLVILAFGYEPLFYVCALLTVIYVIYAKEVLKFCSCKV
ncbi:MFS transporter [Candidatus Micrarchaeota archaeon]|nr:MFS transporter [Candidatus Micrarchaeota archaeon]